jgi:hypothetical protein
MFFLPFVAIMHSLNLSIRQRLELKRKLMAKNQEKNHKDTISDETE